MEESEEDSEDLVDEYEIHDCNLDFCKQNEEESDKS